MAITTELYEFIVKVVEEKTEGIRLLRQDFNDLKAVVFELAQAQKRTEERIEELAQAQKRTEIKVEELAEAQKRSEGRLIRLEVIVEELAQAQKRTEEEIQELTRGLRLTREDLGGLSRNFSYSLENEAYRMLPGFLKQNYGIEMTEKMIRKEIGGKEIDIFGKARKNGRNILIVGETKLRLEKKRDTKEDVFEELEEKILAIRKRYKEGEIVRLLVTHYATPKFIVEARERGIIVIQSFEW